jgi:hypothetical protein
MKVATFNVNGVNRRFTNLLDWLALLPVKCSPQRSSLARDADMTDASTS